MKVCEIVISQPTLMNHPLQPYFSSSSDDDGFEIEHIGNRPRRFRSRINFVTDRTTDTTKRFRMSDDDISFFIF